MPSKDGANTHDRDSVWRPWVSAKAHGIIASDDQGSRIRKKTSLVRCLRLLYFVTQARTAHVTPPDPNRTPRRSHTDRPPRRFPPVSPPARPRPGGSHCPPWYETPRVSWRR